MRRMFAVAVATLVLSVVPGIAQQRVDRSNSSTSDSTWTANDYTFGGVVGGKADPTKANPSCTSNWRVDSAETCQASGTQVTHMSDGCGRTQDGSQACTPPSTASWAYAPISTDYVFTGHYGAVTTYAVFRGCYGSDGSAKAESECTGAAPKEICAIASDGVGCCTPGTKIFGLPFQQSSYALKHFYQCNS